MEIATDVELPELRHQPTKYPFDELRPGHSFLVPADDDDPRAGQRVYQQVSMQNSKGNSRYTSRKVEGGFRVWRIR